MGGVETNQPQTDVFKTATYIMIKEFHKGNM